MRCHGRAAKGLRARATAGQAGNNLQHSGHACDPYVKTRPLLQHFQSGPVAIAFIDEAPTTADRGEPVLLIHGFASNHMVNWVTTGWVKALVHDGRRVIAFDNRGHGASGKLYAPDDYATQ